MSAFVPFVEVPPHVDEVEIVITASDLGVAARVNFRVMDGSTALDTRADDLLPDLTPAQLNHVTKLGEDTLAKARGIL